MKKSYLLQYLRIEYKRMLTGFGHMLLSIVVMLIIIGFGAYGTGLFMSNLTDYEKVNVAIVIPQSDEAATLKKLSTLISMQESVSDMADFIYMSLDDAENGIKEGNVSAAIVFGDTFLNDVMTGINTPVLVLLPKDTQLNTEVFHEEVRDGVSLIRTGESGIYAVTDVWLSGYSMLISRSEMEDLLTNLFTTKALDRNSTIKDISVSAFGENSIEEYYIASAIAMILIFSGLIFANLYTGSDIIVRKKLRINGIGAANSGIVRIAVMTSFLFIISIMMICIIIVYEKYFGGVIGFYFEWNIVPGLLLLAFSFAGFFHFIYSLSDIEAQNAMILLLVAIFMVFSSGCIFPMAFLPEILQKIGMYMPMRMWRIGASQILFSYPSANVFAILFVIGILGGIGGILCQIRKIHS